MDRQHTSIFSEYDRTDVNSVNSRQLQYWLKMLKSSQKNENSIGKQWTFMSSSRYQPQQVSFRVDTFQSNKQNNKENCSFHSNNSNKQTQRSKSYVNAMIALQKRAKTLQEQNNFYKSSLQQYKTQKMKVLTESRAIEQQLRSKLQILEPKTRKLEELLQQNKKLRDIKEQKAKKAKFLQKSLEQSQQETNKLKKVIIQLEQQKQQLNKQSLSSMTQLQNLRTKVQKLTEKNKSLEEIRQKSTSGLIEKYNKSIELTEQLQHENNKLKRQLENVKKSTEDKINNMKQKFMKEIQQMRIQYEKLNFDNLQLNEKIQNLKFQLQQKKQLIKQKDTELLDIVKKSHQESKETKESKEIKINQGQWKKTDMSKESQILPIPPQDYHSYKHEDPVIYQESSELDLDLELQVPMKSPNQTKSLGKVKSQNRKKSAEKSIKSSNQKGKKFHISELTELKNSKQCSRFKNHQRKPYIALPKQRKHKSKDELSNEMKSCQPIPKKKNGSSDLESQYIKFKSAKEDGRNKQIIQLGLDQEIDQFCPVHSVDEQNTLDKLLLLQAQKEAIKLYEQQQKLLNFSTNKCSAAQRAQYVGRMKQLNEQIRLNSQRMFELKSK